jgi:hypothetical protein
MKKIYKSLLLTILPFSLSADILTINPFSVYLNSDKNSIKDGGTINGVYLSNGNLGYLNEFIYTHTDIKYKNSTQNLVQDELTMKYTKFFLNSAYTIGVHTNTTEDVDLQNGTTLILGTKRWEYFGYKKLSYGMNIYQSLYRNGTDLNGMKKNINITSLSANLDYYIPFNNFSNYTSIKYHNEMATTYEKNYSAFEITNIFYFEKYHNIKLNYLIGELQTGVLDNGNTVYNSKDIIKNITKIEYNYQYSDHLKVGVGYSNTTYDEFNFKENLSNDSIVLNLDYKIF